MAIDIRSQTVQEVMKKIQEEQVEFVDLKIVDVPGRWQHITIPASQFDEDAFETGLAFDGSSVKGFRNIEESDMIMLPDPETAFIDPFSASKTLSLTCDIYEPGLTPYVRDPRGVAKRAEDYLRATGIATESYFGPELEFFLFDSIRYQQTQNGAFYEVESDEAIWNSGAPGPNLGYKIRNKEGYFPVAPTDSQQELRNAIVRTLMQCGIEVERHHHEVATAGQAEINFRFGTLTRMADIVLAYKYIVRNVALQHGKTATFMPKPLFGDNGSGMHTHQSLFMNGDPLFYEEGAYGNLSQTALYYLGGILYHAPALLAWTNPSTNSYKRLVPGYEAPVNLVYSKGNRSAAVRVPIAVSSPKAARIEFRTPDCTSNPYLAFAAMLMAGLDGIQQQIDPRELGYGPIDKNIYTLSEEEKKTIRSVPGSLGESLKALESDHEFLLQGGVFSKELIETWLELKWAEVESVQIRPHPYEFHLYYDL